MDRFRAFLDRVGLPFQPGGPLQKWFPLYDALDTIFYTPGKVTRSAAHVRDGVDLKRVMITV